MIHIGNQIEQLRKQKNWRIGYLASRAGVSWRSVQHIEETGNGYYETIEKLLNVLGYEIEIVPNEIYKFTK